MAGGRRCLLFVKVPYFICYLMMTPAARSSFPSSRLTSVAFCVLRWARDRWFERVLSANFAHGRMMTRPGPWPMTTDRILLISHHEDSFCDCNHLCWVSVYMWYGLTWWYTALSLYSPLTAVLIYDLASQSSSFWNNTYNFLFIIKWCKCDIAMTPKYSFY